MTTAKNDLPSDTFDADSVTMTFAASVVKALTDKTEKVLMIPVEKLQPLPGFNVRVKNYAYATRVEEIADSIIANGFYPHKPLGGVILDSDHDHLFIHDGETRWRAVLRAMEKGAEIKTVPVAVAAPGTSVEDLTVSLVQSNEGTALTPIEMAAVVKRLLSFGLSKDDISRRIVKTVRHIDNLLVLAGAPVAVRTAVADNKIAAAEAVKIVRKDPKTAAATVAARVKQAEAVGKTKATPKTARAATGPKMEQHRVEISLATGDKLGDALKAAAKHVRQFVAHANDDTDLLQEDGRVVVIVEVLDRTTVPAKAAKAPAAPKAAKAATAPAKAAAKPATAAKGKQTVQKPSKANGGEGGAPVAAPAAAEGGETATAPIAEGDMGGL